MIDSYVLKVFKTLHNQKVSETLYEMPDGDIVNSKNFVIANRNDADFRDKVDDFVDEWLEVNWSQKDQADWYGCDEDGVDDVIDGDSYDF